jgi:pyruvate/2-oxoglutarate dehydrogenase complex dihydrolipoamide acyltransferase (E2) component
MTTPVVGAARAVAGAGVAGKKLPRGTLAARRKAEKEAAAASAPTPPAPAQPAPKPKQDTKPAPAPKTPEGPSLPNVNVPQPVSSGAGFILALLFWTWIALPFINDGAAGVRAQLKAKFTNKAPDGSYLP